MPNMSAISSSMISGMGPPPTPMHPGMTLASGMGAMTPAMSGLVSPHPGMSGFGNMGPPGGLPPGININNLPPEARAMIAQMR
jgi:hypothetical protein